MGFVSNNPGHEGYPVAFVHRLNKDGSECRGLYRELGYPLDDEIRDDIAVISAGCECGWRSPHWRPSAWWEGEKRHTPRWYPCSASISERDEDRVRELWREHDDAVTQVARRQAEDEHNWNRCGRPVYPEMGGKSVVCELPRGHAGLHDPIRPRSAS